MTVPTVFIVDDDPGMRSSLSILMETTRLKADCFASAEEFLSVCGPHQEGCLLLDVRMPGMSGPDLQEELARRNVRLPIIFLTAYADLPTGVEAMKQGAVDFLTKPINGELLLQRVQVAFEIDRLQRESEVARHLFESRLLKLTNREREVLTLALTGMGNKEISTHLKVSLRTIEGHRSRIYLKIGVSSLIELSQQAVDAGVNLAQAISSLCDATT
ncbi:MAG: response regulator [Sterolibacterium sp.]|nr:response regulator [Sterolibacterium sp.]